MRRFVVASLVGCLALVSPGWLAGASVSAAKASLCAGKTKQKAIKEIKAVWSQVLDYEPGKTLDDRFERIENSDDPEFRATLDGIANTNAGLLPTVTVQVNTVTCKGKKEAEVIFDLVVSGAPAPGLAGPGTAKLIGKQWFFSAGSVCDLFSLADPSLVESGPCAEIALEG